MLRSDSGDGRIVLRDGLVQGAAIKGGPEDLRALLLAEGWIDAPGFDRARSLAGAESLALDEALQRACGLAPERLASLRRQHVERSVMRMFGWRSGEFNFEIRDELSAEDRELLLPSGLNTQYLAMEATRLGDESAQARGAAIDDDLDEMVFSGEDASVRSGARRSIHARDRGRRDRARRRAARGARGRSRRGRRARVERADGPVRTRGGGDRRSRGRAHAGRGIGAPRARGDPDREATAIWWRSTATCRASNGSRHRSTDSAGACTSSSTATRRSIGFAST